MNKSVSLTDNFTEELIISDLDPEEMLIGNESRKELMESMKTYLSDGEMECIRLYIEGHSLMEIASRTGRSEKSADNAVQRAKKKIAKKLEEER